jgi:hypothetical protein
MTAEDDVVLRGMSVVWVTIDRSEVKVRSRKEGKG